MATGENPEALASYRFARGAAIILGILIALALGALVLGFAFRAQTPARSNGETAVSRIALPRGARVLGMEIVSDRIVLRIHSDEGDEIDIVDSGSGKLVSQIKAQARASGR